MNREEMHLEVERIRKQYAEKEPSKRPVKTVAYGFGTVGTLEKRKKEYVHEILKCSEGILEEE